MSVGNLVWAKMEKKIKSVALLLVILGMGGCLGAVSNALDPTLAVPEGRWSATCVTGQVDSLSTDSSAEGTVCSGTDNMLDTFCEISVDDGTMTFKRECGQ